MSRIALAIAMLAIVAIMRGGNALAAELVMFEERGCLWCQRWHAEIGPSYPLSPEGRTAPLRRVHIRDQALAGVLLEKPVTVTPTFVLADGGREVGRIIGYPGNEFFYGLLGGLLGRLPTAPAPRVLRPDVSDGSASPRPSPSEERVRPNGSVIHVTRGTRRLATTPRD